MNQKVHGKTHRTHRNLVLSKLPNLGIRDFAKILKAEFVPASCCWVLIHYPTQSLTYHLRVCRSWIMHISHILILIRLSWKGSISGSEKKHFLASRLCICISFKSVMLRVKRGILDNPQDQETTGNRRRKQDYHVFDPEKDSLTTPVGFLLT